MEIAFHSSKTAAIRGGCQSETGEDFPDGWLPTLDMALRVSEDDKVQKFWEKLKNTMCHILSP